MLHATVVYRALCYDSGHLQWFGHSIATRLRSAIALALRRLLSLFIAAYNAGPGPTKRWIRQFGYHRDADVDVIDLVKSLANRETHNCVQCSTQNLQTYRTWRGEAQVAERIVRDLNRSPPAPLPLPPCKDRLRRTGD